MTTHEDLILQLQARLDEIASPATRDWWEKYLRHVISFRGVGIPDIRRQLAVWRATHGLDRWPAEAQLDVALRLFDSPIAEDKLAGILYLQHYLYDRLAWEVMLDRYEGLYARGLIFDWNTCDWFCVRVLGPTIAKHGPPCARAIAGWRHAADLWQARSAVVAFVPVVADEGYYPLILESCAVLIGCEERFAKTAVGWILRDLSRYDGDLVRAFIDRHLADLTPEALKNALKYAPRDEQQQYLQRLKAERQAAP